LSIKQVCIDKISIKFSIFSTQENKILIIKRAIFSLIGQSPVCWKKLATLEENPFPATFLDITLFPKPDETGHLKTCLCLLNNPTPK
jgi:hypothetical protein